VIKARGPCAKKPKLSIVIPVWNNWDFTKNCLKDLSHLKDVEIIVVDNGSTDETNKELQNFNVEVITIKKNLGFAKACNNGFVIAEGDYVMFLNNDIKVIKNKSNWINPIIEAAQDGGLVGPTVGILKSDFSFVKESNKIPKGGYSYMSGWNVTAKREVWDSLIIEGENGPFSTEFGIAYFEDTDLGFRAREQDIPFKIVNVPVKHFGKMTSKKLNTAKLYTKAKIIFDNKWKERV
jgi:GT2 family glycosyltransferase